jgi:hypothetical protein
MLTDDNSMQTLPAWQKINLTAIELIGTLLVNISSYTATLCMKRTKPTCTRKYAAWKTCSLAESESQEREGMATRGVQDHELNNRENDSVSIAINVH